MGVDKLFGDARRLGVGSSLAILRRNTRLYGWRSTLRKILRRFVAVDSLARHHTASLQRQGIDGVENASSLFGAPSVLIVGALDLPQCKKYRVLQKVEFCEREGWPCHFASYTDEARVLSYLQLVTTLLLYRVPAGPELDVFIAEARRLGVRIAYDIDDPIFDAAVYSENRNLDYITAAEKDVILASTTLYHDAMARADALVLSTDYLASLAREHFATPAFVWRNLVDDATLSATAHLAPRKDQTGGRIVIAYCSGSRAHEEDFRVASDALVQLLADHEQLVLRVIGHADMPLAFEQFGERVEKWPFTGYQQYLQALANADLCVIPLVPDRFNACKSGIRYLEASLCGVPVVASEVGQFTELIDNGINGVLVKGGAEAWLEALSDILDNPSQRRVMAAAARRDVLAHQCVSSPGVVNSSLLEWIAVR